MVVYIDAAVPKLSLPALIVTDNHILSKIHSMTFFIPSACSIYLGSEMEFVKGHIYKTHDGEKDLFS